MKVWQRNMTVYQKIWKINFLPPLLEPLFYLFAFGAGLGALVGSIMYEGSAISYIGYIAPALVSINIMYNAFFENTFASFVRMYYQKTFDAMLATPLSIEEIITGEIVWGATKSVIATAIMLLVISFFGIIHYPAGFLLLPLAFVGGMAFGSVAMFFTAIMPSIDSFNLPMFLFITPMFLFSGTFFPLENLPLWAQKAALIFPLTHLVKLCRAVGLGYLDARLLLNVLYLIVFCAVFFPLALHRMHKRLIK
ncbi:MAG: ABC transporter permease [Spirochaetes bacterium DG_61]|jgi:lipooligosaccharide transport system permease protein|nr:MAG: ABC transporter permease [Spirochaetes bacterium DG_61]